MKKITDTVLNIIVDGVKETIKKHQIIKDFEDTIKKNVNFKLKIKKKEKKYKKIGKKSLFLNKIENCARIKK